jgi:hypothetical protein
MYISDERCQERGCRKLEKIRPPSLREHRWNEGKQEIETDKRRNVTIVYLRYTKWIIESIAQFIKDVKAIHQTHLFGLSQDFIRVALPHRASHVAAGRPPRCRAYQYMRQA